MSQPDRQISRRTLLSGLGTAIVTGFPAIRCSRLQRPNILFIMSDDHAAHAISAYGSRINKTPNIDRIAQGGVRLTNCFVTNSICTPSRAAILTGQYSHVNRVYTLADPLAHGYRPQVQGLLRDAGYTTAIVGKWHLHTDPEGFDYWCVLPGQGRYYNPVFIEMGSKKEFEGHASDVTTDLALNWLKARDKSKPFCLFYHHKAPHRRWEPPKRYMSWYENETIPEPPNLLDDYKNRSNAAKNACLKVGEDMTEEDLKRPIPKNMSWQELRRWAYQYYIKDYLRCVASVDDNVGRVLDYIEQEGLRENTIIIYTSDQGFFLGEHGYYDKRFMYEESLRMPFLIQYPRELPAGTVSDAMVLNIDFAPLLLDYAGVQIPASMQGRSFRPILRGEKVENWRTSMYYRYWMHMAHHCVPAHYGIRTERYKLIYYYGDPMGMSGAVPKPTPPEWELFDLEKDPHEMNNVYNDPHYSDVVEQLKEELARLQTEVGDQPWSPQSA